MFLPPFSDHLLIEVCSEIRSMEVVEGIQKKIVEIKEFVINGDILVYVDEDDRDGIKKRVKQLIEASFVMEDVLVIM